MNFEKQLESIASRSSLHRWVDTIPDDAEAIFLVRQRGPKGWEYRWNDYGNPKTTVAHWMASSFAHYLMDPPGSAEDE